MGAAQNSFIRDLFVTYSWTVGASLFRFEHERILSIQEYKMD